MTVLTHETDSIMYNTDIRPKFIKLMLCVLKSTRFSVIIFYLYSINIVDTNMKLIFQRVQNRKNFSRTISSQAIALIEMN